MATGAAKHTLKQVDRVAGRAGADTIRLWEGYREQAILWRMLALIQIPSTFVAISAAVVMFFFADTIVNVPQMALPGNYSVKELPDAEFINVATELVNLTTSFQPHTARRQFLTARKLLWEPALSKFEKAYMKKELRAIADTQRSHLFYINESKIKLERDPKLDKVVVRIPGTLQKLLGTRVMKPEEMVFYITMTTIPRNVHNEFGIVVIDMTFRRIDFEALTREDRIRYKQALEAKREAEEDK